MSAEAFQFDVFPGHSAKAKAGVRVLAKRFCNDGLKMWFEEWEITPGDSFPPSPGSIVPPTPSNGQWKL